MMFKTIVFTLVFMTLALLSAAVTADLRVTDAAGNSTIYSFSDLDRMVGLIEREIPDDYLFKTVKRYRGYDLNELFTTLGLLTDRQYLLVCADGYEIEFDARKLGDERFKGLLARADVDAADSVWLPYKVGVEPASLEPFYLAWSADSKEAQSVARETLPWPYGLNEIRVHNPDKLHAAAEPGTSAPGDVIHGFEVFTRHCMKCHKINTAGGSLGPELTTSPAVAFTTDEELADVIVNIDRYYTSSKMPTYTDVLTAREIDATVAYLRYINQQASGQ